MSKRPRAYYATCTNPACKRCGEPIEVGDGQPTRAPICDDCGEELQVRTTKKRKVA